MEAELPLLGINLHIKYGELTKPIIHGNKLIARPIKQENLIVETLWLKFKKKKKKRLLQYRGQ